ncbi:KAP family P-loop NTPase fold protein [Pedobacter miscanthi]|uniref:KAP NTPase domain-containing protein n=1 Tax=Pedobacter miscanthi TaxID=2259170 RepID=A0A366LDG9_9SPHI|nr:KAP family NTPase [Pedobacter miscanthi]RBQ11539.1 hypothetical protein DRW42_03495 [Pedobacter miscanthi]
MDQNFSSDNPISRPEDDRFQRYGFSKQIAQTIIGRQSRECITIGIYGAWGEGKTSVLNFIARELHQHTGVVVVKFNPWRYQDENTLLLQFFNLLAQTLDAALKTKKENLGELIGRYSGLVNIPAVGDGSGAAIAVSKMLDQTSVESLKDRIDQIITDKEKKLVIFIDDIDRLEKTEIHSIFRLVKLTADFSNTVYLLSFDEDMVSAAIGERFGEGNAAAGKQFLEKIIQVPLRIPAAQANALQEYSISLINKILDQHEIKIEGEEANRFIKGFQEAIMPKLKNPRLILRYSNTLSFSIPLLLGEVNVVDLMLIEAIKILYPQHYEYIRSDASLFTEGFEDIYSGSADKDKINRFKNQLEKLAVNEDKRIAEALKDLLQSIFPRLEEAFRNISHNPCQDNEWYKRKRIASPNYFNRYFSYCVIKGDLADGIFETFIKTLATRNEAEQDSILKKLMEEGTAENLMRKLRSLEKEYAWPFSSAIARTLTRNSNLLDNDQSDGFFAYMRPYSQSAIFISQLLQAHPDKDEAFTLSLELFSKAEIDYAFALLRWIQAAKEEDQHKLLKESQIDQLSTIILRRARELAGENPLYETFPEYTYRLFGIWHKNDPDGFTQYVSGLIQSHPDGYLKILYALTGQVRSSSNPNSYYTNIDEERYNYITRIIDPELIKNEILKNFDIDSPDLGKIIWDSYGGPYQTDLNIARQFMHCYTQQPQSNEISAGEQTT